MTERLYERLHYCVQNHVLGREVVVESGFRHTEPLRNVTNRCPRVALLVEELHSDGENPVARVHRASTRRTAGHRRPTPLSPGGR